MPLSPVTTSFTQQPSGGAFVINAYGADYLEVNGVRHESSVLVTPMGGPEAFPASVTTLSAPQIQAIAERAPEIVLVGTGSRQIFLSPAILAPLHAIQVGVECMAMGAACRTYNLLALEGRKVLALILFDHPQR